jgi:diguanylate cyclase (GGDEF)-like protein
MKPPWTSSSSRGRDRSRESGSFLMPERLNERLVVAFCLMSVLPLLVLGYIISAYVFPQLKLSSGIPITSLTVVVLVVVWLSFTGWYLVRGVVQAVTRLSSEAQRIASGELEQSVETDAPGEIGELGSALNQITEQVRDNMTQLQNYGEETRQMNLEINRRILSLSNVLQVSNLITQSDKLSEILNTILEKMGQLGDVDLNCLLEFKEEEEIFSVLGISQMMAGKSTFLERKEVAAPWLCNLLSARRTVVLDDSSPKPADRKLFEQLFGMPTGVCQPIVVLGKEWGILISGTEAKGLSYRKDSIELLKVFAKQMSIALENQLLTKRAHELEIIDELTSLYNASYIKRRLEEELRRSRRFHRPCALAFLDLDDFRQFQERAGGLAAEKVLRQVAQLLQAQVSEVDRVGRMGSDEFALILPERSKREAVALLENIRLQMESHLFIKGQNKSAQALTLSAGISENPLDGSTCDDLMTKAAEALKRAKEQGKNRVATL